MTSKETRTLCALLAIKMTEDAMRKGIDALVFTATLASLLKANEMVIKNTGGDYLKEYEALRDTVMADMLSAAPS